MVELEEVVVVEHPAEVVSQEGVSVDEVAPEVDSQAAVVVQVAVAVAVVSRADVVVSAAVDEEATKQYGAKFSSRHNERRLPHFLFSILAQASYHRYLGGHQRRLVFNGGC